MSYQDALNAKGREGFFARIPAVWSYLPIKPGPRCCLTAFVLASNGKNSDGAFDVGTDLLRDLAGVHKATLMRTITDFESYKWLTVDRKGNGKRNWYKLDLDLITEDAIKCRDAVQGSNQDETITTSA